MTACLRSMLKKVIQIPRNEYLSIIVPKYEGVLRCYSQKPYTNRSTVTDPETGVQKKKKTTIIPKITLLDGNNVTVTTLDEAQKISKRRDLKLVKLVDIDTKTQRTVYKLMTGADYHQEDLKQREQKKTQKQNAFSKGEKVLMLNASIGPHDLEVDCKKITKWIEKMYEVRVIINGDKEKSETVFQFLEKQLKDVGRIVQKRDKGVETRFQILPPKKTNNHNDDSNDNSNNNNKL